MADDEWYWLGDRIEFSSPGVSNSRLVRVPPETSEIPPLTAGYAAIAGGSTVGIGLAVFGGITLAARVQDVDGVSAWWWLLLIVPAGAAGLFLLVGTWVDGTERLMQGRAVGRILISVVCGGALVGLVGAWLLPAVSHAGAGRLWAPAAVSAAVSTWAALTAPRAVRDARVEMGRIIDGRRTGRRCAGVIAALPDPGEWNFGGDVPIRYDDGGRTRSVRVRLHATASTIPIPGTPVTVYVMTDGEPLVELDSSTPIEFYPHSSRYESDASGGGS